MASGQQKIQETVCGPPPPSVGRGKGEHTFVVSESWDVCGCVNRQHWAVPGWMKRVGQLLR